MSKAKHPWNLSSTNPYPDKGMFIELTFFAKGKTGSYDSIRSLTGRQKGFAEKALVTGSMRAL